MLSIDGHETVSFGSIDVVHFFEGFRNVNSFPRPGETVGVQSLAASNGFCTVTSGKSRCDVWSPTQELVIDRRVLDGSTLVGLDLYLGPGSYFEPATRTRFALAPLHKELGVNLDKPVDIVRVLNTPGSQQQVTPARRILLNSSLEGPLVVSGWHESKFDLLVYAIEFSVTASAGDVTATVVVGRDEIWSLLCQEGARYTVMLGRRAGESTIRMSIARESGIIRDFWKNFSKGPTKS